MERAVKKMSEMENIYYGRPAAILGGGPSLPLDMARLPKDCILIAVNYHYELLTGLTPEFMVFNDHPNEVVNPLLGEYVESTKAVKVSPTPKHSDILCDVDVWTGFYSSNTAAWFALWMGCAPVILCGMDCYQGDQIYCHPFNGYDCPAFHQPLYDILRPWIEDGKNILPHVEQLKVMSGPLVNIFGAYAA